MVSKLCSIVAMNDDYVGATERIRVFRFWCLKRLRDRTAHKRRPTLKQVPIKDLKKINYM